jgi:hypothetical protein
LGAGLLDFDRPLTSLAMAGRTRHSAEAAMKLDDSPGVQWNMKRESYRITVLAPMATPNK